MFLRIYVNVICLNEYGIINIKLKKLNSKYTLIIKFREKNS